MRRQDARGITVTYRDPDPVRDREVAAAGLRTMLSRYNLAEFQAQTHAVEMIDMLAGIALDPTAPLDMRRNCANDVLDRAYGKAATQARVEIIDPATRDPGGGTAGEAMRAAVASADLFRRLTDLTMRGVPSNLWPEDVLAAAGAGVAEAYAVEVKDIG